MTPKELVREWVELFNRSDAAGLAELYPPDALLLLGITCTVARNKTVV